MLFKFACKMVYARSVWSLIHSKNRNNSSSWKTYTQNDRRWLRKQREGFGRHSAWRNDMQISAPQKRKLIDDSSGHRQSHSTFKWLVWSSSCRTQSKIQQMHNFRMEPHMITLKKHGSPNLHLLGASIWVQSTGQLWNVVQFFFSSNWKQAQLSGKWCGMYFQERTNSCKKE